MPAKLFVWFICKHTIFRAHFLIWLQRIYQSVGIFQKNWFKVFLDRRQRGPITSVLLVIIGWLVGWLVGNAFFSETAPRIFLIFCMKLGDYEGKKVIEPHFWKKFLIWRYSRKRRQISAKSDILIFFSKTAVKNFFSFWPEVSTKHEFQFEWSLFSRKNYNLEIFVLEIVKKLPKLRFLAIFATSHHEFFFILYIVIGGHDV